MDKIRVNEMVLKPFSEIVFSPMAAIKLENSELDRLWYISV